MAEYPTPLSVVLTTGGVFYDGGRATGLPEGLELTNLAHVLTGCANTFRSGEGVAIVDTPMPTVAPELDGWTFVGLRPWTTFVRQADGAVVHLGFWPDLTTTGPGPLLAGNNGPADLAWRLGRYNRLTGSPWRYTAGVSGCAALRAMFTDPRPGSQPLWRHDGVKGIRGAGPLIWRGSELRNADGIVVSFDINAQYLAAMKSARLAWGPLEHTGAVAFDPSWPGYWEIGAAQLGPLLNAERPPLAGRGRLHNGALWLSTPAVKYATERLGTLDVLDSYTSDNGETIVRRYAERLASVRAGDLGPLGPTALAVKRTYAELVGIMARPGGSVYRPDWSAQIIDLARVNLLRRLDRAADRLGLVPFEVRTDAAYYFLQDREIVTRLAEVLGVGTGPGTFKNAKVVTAGEFIGAQVSTR